MHISQTIQGLDRSGHKLQIGIAEETHRLQSCLRRGFIIHHIELAWSQLQLAEHHTRTNRHLLACIPETQVATHEGIGHLFRKLLFEVDVDVADIPLSLGFRFDAIYHRESHVHLARHIHRVGKIGSVTVLIEIIALIAEKSGQSLALLLQLRDIERTALPDKCLRHGGIDELLAMLREIEISHGIQAPEMPHIYLISHLRLLRITLGLHLIIYPAIEIAVFI